MKSRLTQYTHRRQLTVPFVAFSASSVAASRDGKAHDPETNFRRALVHGWAELPGSERGLTVAEAIKHATLVIIPARASLFDIAALQDTVQFAREMRKPPRRSV